MCLLFVTLLDAGTDYTLERSHLVEGDVDADVEDRQYRRLGRRDGQLGVA